MRSTAHSRRTWLLLAFASLLTAGCGGGGGGPGAPPPAADTTPPAVTAASPANNATGVAVSTLVSATFSEAVKNVGPATFTLAPAAGGAGINGTVTLNGTTATFTPSANLAYVTSYRATVTTGVMDLANNAMAASHTWTFTTGAAPDTTPPTVTSTAPPDGQSGVAVGTVVTATFSEAVGNVGPATFTLAPAAGGPGVTGTVAVNGNSATLTPFADLAYLTTYAATVTTGVTDLSNNALAADHRWTFTTGAAPLPCLDCHGVGGSQAGVNGAPVITMHWQTSGHGRGAAPLQCTDCHEVGSPVGAHAADGTGTFDTLLWPGKPADTTNANTAHLKNFFFPAAPASAADYALAFDEACGNRLGCHARVGGGRIVRVMTHTIWDNTDADYLMEFGNHGTAPDPKAWTWYVQTAYPDDFYKSQSPWVVQDLTTDAAAAPTIYGTCVTCHDPHGTGTTALNNAGRNVMVRGNFNSPTGGFCNSVPCHWGW